MINPSSIAARAGRWSARHRRAAILGWVAFVVLAIALGSAVGTRTIDDDFGPGESGRADRALDTAFNDNARESVLVQSRHGSSQDSEFAAGVRDLLARLRATGVAVHVESPLARGNEEQISDDGRTAVVQLEVRGTKDGATSKVADPVARLMAATATTARRHPSLRMEEIGELSAERAFDDALERDLKKAETLSVPLTLAILVVAFGALAAAGIPVVLAITAVLATTGLAGIASHIAPVDEATSNLILLIGMAVGVDYSLFYLRREREERAAGRSSMAAVETAAATSGHSILVSGLTVMVALAGMYFAGDSSFQSFATGTILVVAVAVIGSLTVLPALLSRLGDKVMKGRVPLVARRREAGRESRVWSSVLRQVLRRPATAAIASGALLLALAIPALGLQTGNAAEAALPDGIPMKATMDRMDSAFPGGGSPAVVVVEAQDVTAPTVRRAIHELERLARRSGRFPERPEVEVSPSREVAAVVLPIAGNGSDARSEAALAHLREDLIPRALGGLEGVRAQVTGMTAGSVDFNHQMSSRVPIVFGFVVLMAFLLLMVTFRSIVIPLKAIVLNLLSVGAAYGVLVLVFQHGWGHSLLGFETPGVIESWLPVFLFVVLFGLSMDYHVFILSRIREAFDRGASTDEAVAHGIGSTAGVVTSAALVMVAVFATFASLSALMFKELGVGLAAAILIDATIVRAVLLPATMKLLGDRNWYMPRCLEWLPRPAERAVR
jgi:RND superfamily putative drug exporter